MRSCCFFLFAVLFYSNAFCQFPVDQGAINLGGEISFSTTSTEYNDDNTNVLYVIPQAYFFVINNLAVGGDVQFMRTSRGDNVTSIFGIGPGIKYFFRVGNLYPYLSGSFLYTIKSWKSKNDTQKVADISVGGGMDIFISMNVAVEPYLKYHIMSSKYGNHYSISSKMFQIGIGLGAFIF